MFLLKRLTQFFILFWLSCLFSLPSYAVDFEQSVCIGNIDGHIIGHSLYFPHLCDLTDKDVPAILSFLNHHPELTSLILRHNKIGSKGAVLLSQNKTLKRLEISTNNIGVEGAKAIAKMNLATLFINNNNIGDEGALALAANQTLTHIEAYGNNIGNKGAMALANNLNVKHLNLRFNHIGSIGITALTNSKHFEALDTSHNDG